MCDFGISDPLETGCDNCGQVFGFDCSANDNDLGGSFCEPICNDGLK